MTPTQEQNVPNLRFPEFKDNENNGLQNVLFADLFSFSSGKNIKQDEASPDFKTPCVRYGELYHLYGEVIKKVINKTNIPSLELRFSDGDEILLPSAGEDPLDIGSASALTLKGVAIGRTINVLKPLRKNEYSPVFASYYINSSLRKQISCLARGSSISNVYNSDLKTLKINLPTLPEQRKIAGFLGAMDEKIAQLSCKKALFEDYKKGCMQQFFSQNIRFRDDNGNDFPDWEEKPLNAFLTETKKKSDGTEPVFSVSVHKGLINQIEHLGRSFSASDTSHYSRVDPGDVVYTKSPTGDFPLGIIKQSKLDFSVIVSPLYGVFQPETPWLGYWLNVYFESHVNVGNYLKPIIQKGAKNTINITNTTFLSAYLKVPVHPTEQRKIAGFLSSLDRKIDLVAQELAYTRSYKAGLLQQMFV